MVACVGVNERSGRCEPAGMPGVATVVVDRWRRHHEVLILIAAGGGEGRCLGSHPRAKVSMTIVRPPQHGHGRGSMRGSSIAALGGSGCFVGAGTASSSRARAIFSDRLPLASSP